MKKILFTILVLTMLAMGIAAQQSTSFSYQGRLTGGGAAAKGTYDFVFELFSQPTGGTALGSVARPGVTVTGGIFTVQLDFGAATFDGTDRYIAISVKLPADSSYTTLAPRQKLDSVPYATRAISSENAQNSTNLGGVPASEFLQKTGDGSQLTNLSGAQLANNSVNITQLSPDALPNNYNLKLLASRRWDLLKPQRSFSVGPNAAVIEFDGTYLWVGSLGNNSISKVRASDGAVVQTIDIARQINALTFDGQNIWVTNSGPNSVTKIRASDGVTLGYFGSGYVSGSPNAIAFDGEFIWITDVVNNSVIKKNIVNGGSQAFIPVGNFPLGIAFDGANMWVTNNNSGSVTKIRTSDNVVVGTYPVTVSGAGARGIAFDGTNIWVASSGTNVTKLRASDGANLGIFAIPGFTFSQSVGFDGSNIWVTDSSGSSVVKIRPSDGAVLTTYPVGSNPQGIAFDGANIWTGTTSGSAITRLPPAFSQP